MKATPAVKWRQVESSNVARVGWDDYGTMYVTYKSGVTYSYIGVSRQRAVACAYAPSVGSYINKRIKGHFKPVKIG